MKNINWQFTIQVSNMIQDRAYVLCLRSLPIVVYKSVMGLLYKPVLNSVGRRINIKK